MAIPGVPMNCEKKKKKDNSGYWAEREPTVNKYSNNTHSMMTDGMGTLYRLLLTDHDDHYPFENMRLWGKEFTEDTRP